MKTRIIVILIILAILSILYYVFAPFIDAYKTNRHLDISGVKLLMTHSEVEKYLGKGTSIGGFGADFYTYRNNSITIAFHSDGLLKNKAAQIDISDSEYNLFGVHPGEALDKAELILSKYGFKQDPLNNGSFEKGSTHIVVFSNSIRVQIEDWTLRGRVY